MICDEFKIVELAKGYLEISKSAAYFIEVWNTEDVVFTKDDKIMPLFAGSIVCAQKDKKICAVISFDKKSGKCEIAHAYPDIEDNTVWKLCEESCSCMADRNLTVSRMNEPFVSDLQDSEKAFDLLYDAVMDYLNSDDCEELLAETGRNFIKDVHSCVDAEKIIISVFSFSLIIEYYRGIHFQVAEKIVVAACVIMNHFIYKNAADKNRCDIFDQIIKTAMSRAMKAAIKDNPVFYGVDEDQVEYDTGEDLMDFIEDVYGRFKKMFQCFYPGITW